MLLKSKIQKRLALVFSNSIYQVIIPVFNVLISLLVIRFESVTLWGEFVYVLIIAQLVFQIIFWGNKEYVLREISLNPAKLPEIWQSNLFTRSSLILPFILILVFSGFSWQRSLLVLFLVFGTVFYQAYESLILYTRRFTLSIGLAAAGHTLLILAIVFLRENLRVDLLLLLYGIAAAIRGLGLTVLFRRESWRRFAGQIDLRIFKLAFPFFLLSLSGMLISKTDLYCVGYLLPEGDLGKYQVYITMFIYLQAAANFILMPFLKGIYRLDAETIKNISKRLSGIGLIVLLPALGLIHVLLTFIYGFDFSTEWYVYGALFAFPAYFYLPRIYMLYKFRQEKSVLKANIVGVGINLLLNVILITYMGLIGAIISGAVSQWVMLTTYVYYARNLAHGKNQDVTLSHLPPTGDRSTEM